MTWASETFMGLDPYQPHGRLALFLRRALGDAHQTKRLANVINCTPKAAENILAGTWPNARHWARLVAAFGRDLTDAVFHPQETVERLEREIHQLEQEIAAREAALRDMPSHLASGSRGVAALGQRATVTRAGSRPAEPQHINP